MTINLKGQSFLKLIDFTSDEIKHLLDLSTQLKKKKRSGIRDELLSGKNIALVFEKASTRTRCAFEVAAYDEGACVTCLTNSHFGIKESVEDSANVLGRYYDGIEFRGYKQDTVETLAECAGVPVWNGLTDEYHPTQILADLLTIEEHIKKPLNEIKILYVGDARNNMGNSWMAGAAKMGMNFVGLSPKTLAPEAARVTAMQDIAKKHGGSIAFTENMLEAVKDADVIYTDVWVSMGEEDHYAERIEKLSAYQVTMDMIKASGNEDIKFMHCLPAFHDRETEVGEKMHTLYGIDAMEVTDEVFRSKHSIVFDQAENRLHTIKAVLIATL